MKDNLKNISVTLGVGIPTYNRPEALCRRIKEVDSFVGLIDELVICDNSEDENPSVKAALNSISVKYSYKKNQANIGGGANFIRVVENSTSDYLWWRGDDDVISSGQLKAVINSLIIQSRLILLSPAENQIFIGKGIEAFIDNFDKVKTMGWLSSIVLPVGIAQQALSWGYFGVASGWANVTLVLGLFRACPNLEFIVVPVKMSKGDFRELGRDALRWALFNTCIKQFPMTASVLPSQELRHKYLANWRTTHGFQWIRTMTRFKLGYMCNEKLTFTTFLPFISFSNIRATLLGLTLYLMSKLPKLFYQIVFPIYWLSISQDMRVSLELDFLLPCKSFPSVFNALRTNKTKEFVEGFL